MQVGGQGGTEKQNYQWDWDREGLSMGLGGLRGG